MRHPTITAARVHGAQGGYITTRGEPRYAQLNGEHYVVGRGNATRCDTITEAYAWRDALLAVERGKRRAQTQARATARAAAPAVAPSQAAAAGIAIGDVVKFVLAHHVGQTADWQPLHAYAKGKVIEIGDRSLAIETDKGDTYRRAVADCTKVPECPVCRDGVVGQCTCTATEAAVKQQRAKVPA